MSESSYLRDFSAKVSQIVFLASLTVLYGLLLQFDLKCQKNHYWTDFSAQISQSVFLAYLTVFTAYYNCKDLK